MIIRFSRALLGSLHLTPLSSAGNYSATVPMDSLASVIVQALRGVQTLRDNEVDETGTQTFQYTTSTHPDAYSHWKTKTLAGGSDGRLWREKSRKGKNGAPEIIRELKYLTRTGN